MTKPSDRTATYIDAGEQALMVDRRSWPGASDEVIKTINRVLGAAAERFDGLSVTNSKNYFTAHFSGKHIQRQISSCASTLAVAGRRWEPRKTN